MEWYIYNLDENLYRGICGYRKFDTDHRRNRSAKTCCDHDQGAWKNAPLRSLTDSGDVAWKSPDRKFESACLSISWRSRIYYILHRQYQIDGLEGGTQCRKGEIVCFRSCVSLNASNHIIDGFVFSLVRRTRWR